MKSFVINPFLKSVMICDSDFENTATVRSMRFVLSKVKKSYRKSLT